jgi:aryl-alcohol dehydrogenase-like predicted oxidoreductase
VTGSDEVWPARQVGDMSVWPIGLGAMELTFPHTPTGQLRTPVDPDHAVRVIHAALDAGIRLIDTAINYSIDPEGMGANEALVARALSTWSGDRDAVVITAKGGNRRAEDALWRHDATPENLRWSCETSAKALGVEAIGLYFLHAPDPHVPLSESIGALAELQSEGKIRQIGVSNLGRRQLAEARAIVDIVAVENQLSPFARAATALARDCAERSTAFLAWSPLGGQLGSGGLRQRHPGLARIADERGVSVQQVVLAWLLAQSPNVIPIPSAVEIEHVRDNAAAASLRLTPQEHEDIDAATIASEVPRDE